MDEPERRITYMRGTESRGDKGMLELASVCFRRYTCYIGTRQARMQGGAGGPWPPSRNLRSRFAHKGPL